MYLLYWANGCDLVLVQGLQEALFVRLFTRPGVMHWWVFFSFAIVFLQGEDIKCCQGPALVA